MSEQTLETLNVDLIEYSDEFNCRGRIVAASCRELADSIKREGLGQPITVAPKGDGTYKLITGHRRFIAVTKLLRRKKISAIIDPALIDPEKAKVVNLTENIQRADLTLLQELRSVQSMLNLGIEKKEIARRCGKTNGWIEQRMKVKDLPAVIQQELDAGLLKMSQVTTLHDYTYMKDKNRIFEIAKEMKKANQNRRNFDEKRHLTNQNKKVSRTKKEIQAMRDHFLEYFDPCLGSRLLGWACGEISDHNMHAFIGEYGAENDFEFIVGIDSYDKPF